MDLDINDAIGSDECWPRVRLTQLCGSREIKRTIGLFTRGQLHRPLVAALPPPSFSVTPFLCGEYLCWVCGDGILCVS